MDSNFQVMSQKLIGFKSKSFDSAIQQIPQKKRKKKVLIQNHIHIKFHFHGEEAVDSDDNRVAKVMFFVCLFVFYTPNQAYLKVLLIVL